MSRHAEQPIANARYEIRPGRLIEPSHGPRLAARHYRLVEDVTDVTALTGSLQWLADYCERHGLDFVVSEKLATVDVEPFMPQAFNGHGDTHRTRYYE